MDVKNRQPWNLGSPTTGQGVRHKECETEPQQIIGGPRGATNGRSHMTPRDSAGPQSDLSRNTRSAPPVARGRRPVREGWTRTTNATSSDQEAQRSLDPVMHVFRSNNGTGEQDFAKAQYNQVLGCVYETVVTRPRRATHIITCIQSRDRAGSLLNQSSKLQYDCRQTGRRSAAPMSPSGNN
jgi:hypothetical protein